MIRLFLRRLMLGLVAIAGLILSIIYIVYGTLSPCHIAASDLKQALGITASSANDTDDGLMAELGGLLGEVLAAPYIDDRADNGNRMQCVRFIWQTRIERRAIDDVDQDAMGWLAP